MLPACSPGGGADSGAATGAGALHVTDISESKHAIAGTINDLMCIFIKSPDFSHQLPDSIGT